MPAVVAGQAPPPDAAALTTQDQALRLFIDCERVPCDGDFFRTELPWVNHVRDREDADVHLLITGEPTGAGGSQFTFEFIGLRAFVGRNVRMSHATQPNEPFDTTRRGILRVMQLGLMPYVIETPLADTLQVTRLPRAAAAPAVTTEVHDPWDFWVLRLRVGGNFNGEATSKNSSVNGQVSANRTTEAWKHNLSTNINYSEREFTLSSGEKFTTVQRNMNVNGSTFKSLDDHWSTGVRGSVRSDTFVNQDLVYGFAPGIEWNVFPYNESTRRMFTFQYTVGLNRFHYDTETIYGKLEETLWNHALGISLDLSQPWGSTGVSVDTQQYLHDVSKYSVRVFGNAEFRVIRGLSLNIDGNVQRVHDQLYLQRGEASDEDILVRQRQLATSYRYGVSFSVSYTFGSIFNNVVNPRFR